MMFHTHKACRVQNEVPYMTIKRLHRCYCLGLEHGQQRQQAIQNHRLGSVSTANHRINVLVMVVTHCPVSSQYDFLSFLINQIRHSTASGDASNTTDQPIYS
ncbi:hypothetical protein, unlikely [Trypanosoma congolense IL3000]|uniref:Uncharacterized protein n=1 Tax=Trypanosoma congolense (strain IL3000) TaxID=1068625 RepID=F9W534_TRYCI|nr:hypothetical protein, unlikely [Trypanosoma congolense IL3000]